MPFNAAIFSSSLLRAAFCGAPRLVEATGRPLGQPAWLAHSCRLLEVLRCSWLGRSLRLVFLFASFVRSPAPVGAVLARLAAVGALVRFSRRSFFVAGSHQWSS